MSMDPLAGAQVLANASHSDIIASRFPRMKSESATRVSSNGKALLDGSQKVLVSDWLRDVAIASGGANAFLVPLHRKRRQRDYGNIGCGLVRLQKTDCLQTVHSRELDVHQDQRRLFFNGHPHARFRIRRLEDCVSLRLEQKLRKRHVRRIVFDYQDRCHQTDTLRPAMARRTSDVRSSGLKLPFSM